MSRFVIARKSDSMIMINNRTRKEYYASMGRATAALTRMVNNKQLPENEEADEHGLISSLYACYEFDHYVKNVEQYITVRNLMSGKPVRQSVNTPLCCDVSSETYWSM